MRPLLTPIPSGDTPERMGLVVILGTILPR